MTFFWTASKMSSVVGSLIRENSIEIEPVIIIKIDTIFLVAEVARQPHVSIQIVFEGNSHINERKIPCFLRQSLLWSPNECFKIFYCTINIQSFGDIELFLYHNQRSFRDCSIETYTSSCGRCSIKLEVNDWRKHVDNVQKQ